MNARHDGGPAFPVAADPDMQNQAWGGMTLRDYFAAKAMPLAMSEWVGIFSQGGRPTLDEVSRFDIAEFAYAYADAMIAARSA